MDNVILALPAECWRWIPGYEGIYQVSTRGRVRSVGKWVTFKNGRKRFYEGRILKPLRDKQGYLHIGLHRNGIQSQFLIHRLVLEVWGDGNPENKPQVNHINECKTDNDVYNLEWCTAKYNVNYGTRNKRDAASQLNGRQSIPVQALDPKTGEVVREFPSMMEAQRNGFDSGTICNCCQDKKRTHKGYMWRYKD